MSEGFWTRDPDGRWMYLDAHTNQPLPWPASNDEPVEVQVEMRAAELADGYGDGIHLAGAASSSIMQMSLNGYYDRELDEVDAASHNDHEAAGWLMHAIHAHDEEQGALPGEALVAVTPHDPTGSPIVLDGIDQSEPGETTEIDIEGES